MYDDYAAYDPSANPGMTGDMVIGTYGWIITLAYFGLFMFLQYKIAHRTGHADTAWWAFVPILNTLLLIGMAGKPIKWFWLLMIPFVNFFAFFALWISVARNCGQSGVWGFFCMFPLINILPMFVLAMSTRPYSYPNFSDETSPPRPRKPEQVG